VVAALLDSFRIKQGNQFVGLALLGSLHLWMEALLALYAHLGNFRIRLSNLLVINVKITVSVDWVLQFARSAIIKLDFSPIRYARVVLPVELESIFLITILQISAALHALEVYTVHRRTRPNVYHVRRDYILKKVQVLVIHVLWGNIRSDQSSPSVRYVLQGSSRQQTQAQRAMCAKRERTNLYQEQVRANTAQREDLLQFKVRQFAPCALVELLSGLDLILKKIAFFVMKVITGVHRIELARYVQTHLESDVQRTAQFLMLILGSTEWIQQRSFSVHQK
jgi:hypothetical protein